MKTLILYDSVYENTEKIANAIGKGIDSQVNVLHVAPVETSLLKELDLLVVGSPVHGGMPTPAVQHFLTKIESGALKGVKVAAFDTRFAREDHGLGIKVLMSVIRFAAERISRELVKKGGTLVLPPEGFIVNDKQGPLQEGEIERATRWGTSLYNLSK